MNILVVEDDTALNHGIALSLNTDTILQAFCISFTTNILTLKKWLPKTATLFHFNFFDPNY